MRTTLAAGAPVSSTAGPGEEGGQWTCGTASPDVQNSTLQGWKETVTWHVRPTGSDVSLQARNSTGHLPSQHSSYGAQNKNKGPSVPYLNSSAFQRVDVMWFLLCENLCTRSTRCTISLSEMPGQDSSARLKAFSSSSRAPTLPPLCLCFSLSSPKTGRTSVDRHWDLGCLLTGSAGFCELCRAVPL